MENDRATKSSKYNKWTILYAGFVVAWAALALLSAQYIISLILQIIVGSNIAARPFWTLIYYILNYSLAIIFIIWLPAKVWAIYKKRKKISKQKDQDVSELTKTTPTDMGMQAWPTFVDIGLAPIAYVVYTILGNAAQEIMKNFSWFDAGQSQNVGFSYFITGWEQLAAVIAIVFIAPLAEEIIMRGWVYGKLRKRLNIIIAMLLTSILFGALHGQWNVAVTTFILSLILCGLREITGTIWSGVLLHMLVNGVAFYVLYIASY